MVIPVNPLNTQPIKSKSDTQKASTTDAAVFRNVLKNSAADLSGYVPEAWAPYKEDFKKKRLSEEKLWEGNGEEEETENVQSLLKKIEERLRKLRKIAENEKST